MLVGFRGVPRTRSEFVSMSLNLFELNLDFNETILNLMGLVSWNLRGKLYLSDLLTRRSGISPKKTPQRRHRRLGCLYLEARN